ncbi:hypothetical protein HK099_001182 [Clydaea vesicula]|uniref:Anoctamin n=1 Tax=Clydaea vesicula TaxID=447962 RepID=A0AAD5U3N8_9FUNG|nr:hypothetical protein HK099_001182 [Clydaea vesicula]
MSVNDSKQTSRYDDTFYSAYETDFSPSISIDFPHSATERTHSLKIINDKIITRTITQTTFLHLYNNKEALLFDKILKFKLKNPNSTLNGALDQFIKYNKAEILCRLLYNDETLLPSAVLKLKFNKKSETEEKINKKNNYIGDFEVEMLRQGLFCVFELAIEDDIDEESWYIKILSPFSTLSDEAEKVHLKLPTLLKKADLVRNRLQEKALLHKELTTRKKQNALQISNRTVSEHDVSDASIDSCSDLDESHSESLRRRTLRRKVHGEEEHLIPLKYEPTFMEGPDGTIKGSLRYIFCTIKDTSIPHLDIFKKKNIKDFVGGNQEKKLLLQKFFSSSHKSLLTYGIINRCKIYVKKENEEEIKVYGIEELLLNNTFCDFFALHSGPYKPLNESTRSKLFYDMKFHKHLLFNLKSLLAYVPLKNVRHYFGEKIAFYFAWITFYTLWCWLAALAGLIVFWYGVYHSLTTTSTITIDVFNVFDNALTTPYALFMSLWALIFLEFWKRQEITLQVVWGITEMHKLKMYRPQWRGTDIRRSPVTGLMEKYHPKKKRVALKILSTLVLGLGITFIVFLQVLIIVFQASGKRKPLEASSLGAAFSLLNIIVFTPIYLKLARILTDIENHKTEGGWENSFIAKEFTLNFVLTYTTLIFIGVIKVFIKEVWNPFEGHLNASTHVEGNICKDGSCLAELNIQMIIIFMGYQYLTQIFEILFAPLKRLVIKIIDYFTKTAEEKEKKKKNLIFYDDEKLEKYVQRYDFSTKIIQFGFLTLFSCAFPLAPFFALISNIFEVRMDLYKLLTQAQRPFSLRQKDIGLWLDLLNFLALFGPFVNSMVIAFNRCDKVFKMFP